MRSTTRDANIDIGVPSRIGITDDTNAPACAKCGRHVTSQSFATHLLLCGASGRVDDRIVADPVESDGTTVLAGTGIPCVRPWEKAKPNDKENENREHGRKV